MRIEELTKDGKEWQSFLKGHKHLIFHTPKFKQFIEETFKNTKTVYLAAVEEGEIKTIFPFFFIKHAIFGKKIISAVFIEYGGPAGDVTYVCGMIDYFKSKYANGVDYIEVRHGFDEADVTLTNCFKKDVKFKKFILKLGDADTIWKKVDKMRKKAVKKAEKSGIVVKELSEDDVDELYNLYLKNMKSFGSPPYPKEFFINFFKYKLGKCYGSFYDNKLVAMLLGYICNERIHIVIAVSDDKYLNYRPNDAMHWEFIKFGCDNDFKIFDFGRVKEESGQFDFKRRWGAELFDLPHYYYMCKGQKELPNIDIDNFKFKLLISVWKRLPLFVTKWIGPWIREGLGI